MNDISSLNYFDDWFENFLNFERLPKKDIFWLDTMNFLCKKFHYPQDSFKSIHVAGSKGKGSVSTMIASIIKAYKKSCGLYTSPHLLSFLERITLASNFFPKSVYEEAFNELTPIIDAIILEQLPEQREITWFELVTLYSFLVFQKANVEWAVFETGLGGRLDATNVLSPELCVLTPIELEHTEFLGKTVEKIAGEKAGIIKNKTPVCCSAQKNSVREVFNKVAKEKQTEIFYVDDYLKKYEFEYVQNGMKITLHFDDFFRRPISTTLAMRGEIQLQNAALASLAVKKIFPDITESIIEKGLSQAFLPARFEIFSERTTEPKRPEMIIDGAHTLNSINFTIQTLKSLNYNNVDVLFACAADKNMHDIAPLFFSEKIAFSNITLTKPGFVKEADFPLLEKCFSNEQKKTTQNVNCFYEPDCKIAIEQSLNRAIENKHLLLVIGSFYLAAEVKTELAPLLQDAEKK